LEILWLTNIPSPYRVDFFNELGKKVELEVLFEMKHTNRRNDEWKKYNFENFKGIFLNEISFYKDYIINFKVIKYLKRNEYDYIVISNPMRPTGMLAIEYLRLKKIPYIIETDGGFPKSGEGLKGKLKTHILKGADLYLSTADMHDKYYLKYGAEKNKIVRYPFSSIKQNDVLDKPLNFKEKGELKTKLGIKGEKMILSVGRFIYGKGFDILIKAAKNIDKKISIYIVGGSPTKEYLSLINKYDLTNVYFEGFKTQEELSLFYKAADLFVLPTRKDVWGLVINEAMASGLPVITTDRCIAGLELINNGENGFIIETENEKQLADRINEIIPDQDLLDEMSRNSLEIIRKYTIETMVERHLNIFNNGDLK
jgi:glycosyltransferase involved in cell wall biosynthesis